MGARPGKDTDIQTGKHTYSHKIKTNLKDIRKNESKTSEENT